MLKIIIIVVIVIVVLGAGIMAYFAFFAKPDVSRYEPLKTPRLTDLPAKNMLVVSIKGEPSKALPPAFGQLFKVYFQLKEAPKGPGMSAPILRCQGNSLEAFTKPSAADWVGEIGLPVPETITSLPADAAKDPIPVTLRRWEYGKTAEILHIGPYDKEIPTVERLLTFIKEQGYEPVGIHEEEYLIGPGVWFTSPDQYYTIIRYPVVKAAS